MQPFLLARTILTSQQLIKSDYPTPMFSWQKFAAFRFSSQRPTTVTHSASNFAFLLNQEKVSA